MTASTPVAPPFVGIVIRADGTVPFDDDVSHELRAHYLTFLTDNEHVFDLVPGTRHVRIRAWHPGKDVHKKPAV